MDGAGSSACPGPTGSAGRYLSGLCVAGLGLCAAGWLVLTPFAFAVIESMLAGAELLMTGCDEEEAW